MVWIRRTLVSIPFAVAGLLTILTSLADRLHLRIEHLAGYGFLFFAPWAWLLDHDWFGAISQSLDRICGHLPDYSLGSGRALQRMYLAISEGIASSAAASGLEPPERSAKDEIIVHTGFSRRRQWEIWLAGPEVAHASADA